MTGIGRKGRDLAFALLFGIFWEFLSAGFWVYGGAVRDSTIAGRVSLLILLYWMAYFFTASSISEMFFRRLFGPLPPMGLDARLYAVDTLTFGIVGIIFEIVLGAVGWVSYHPELRWTTIPLLNLPWNVAAGYFGIGMFVPPALRAFRRLDRSRRPR